MGHEEGSRNIDATCTLPGYNGQIYCTRCGEIINPGEKAAALGHQWDEGTVTTEPTESTEGVKTFTCTRAGCSETMTAPLPATGGSDCRHEHTEVRSQAATCTEDGYAGAVYCRDCQKMIYGGEVEEALGHDQEIRGRIEASGVQDGYTGDTYCKRCEELLESGKAIPKAYAVVNDAALGDGKSEFNFSEGWTYEKADSSVGCYEDDNHWSDAEGAVLTIQFTGTNVKYFAQKAANLGYAAFSIDYGEEEEINLYQAEKENQVLIYESGDLQPGEHTLKVRVTGKAGIEGGTGVVVADKIEVYCNHQGEEANERNTATCTQAGNIETYGTICGQQVSQGEPSAALGHEESVRGRKDADCTEAGHTGETYCERCHQVLNPGSEIPALGHQWDEGVVTKQPTTEKTGEKVYTCTVCKVTDIKILPKKEAATTKPTPQAPKKGSKLKHTSSKAEYKVLSAKVSKGKITGTVSYIKPQNKTAKTVKIPAQITVNGGTYKVTAIADKAFCNHKKLTKVIIGNNVTKIGVKAFYNCKKLKTVTIGKKVETIGNSAFSKCTALTKMTIPAKVKKIGKQSFAGCKKLKTITIKTKKLKKSSVGSSAFKGISTKATIKVPKSKLKSYKSILRSRGVSRKVKIKKV